MDAGKARGQVARGQAGKKQGCGEGTRTTKEKKKLEGTWTRGDHAWQRQHPRLNRLQGKLVSLRGDTKKFPLWVRLADRPTWYEVVAQIRCDGNLTLLIRRRDGSKQVTMREDAITGTKRSREDGTMTVELAGRPGLVEFKAPDPAVHADAGDAGGGDAAPSKVEVVEETTSETLGELNRIKVSAIELMGVIRELLSLKVEDRRRRDTAMYLVARRHHLSMDEASAMTARIRALLKTVGLDARGHLELPAVSSGERPKAREVVQAAVDLPLVYVRGQLGFSPASMKARLDEIVRERLLREAGGALNDEEWEQLMDARRTAGGAATAGAQQR